MKNKREDSYETLRTMVANLPPAADEITHRLNGASASTSAPTLVFVNDIRTNLHIWDPLISELELAFPEYKLLRYSKITHSRLIYS
jgi:hypothetical protein